MKRHFVLGSLVVIGGVVVGVGAFVNAPALEAQQPAPMVIEVDKLRDNLFVLRGGGGNTAVFVQANGVTVEDLDRPALVPGMRKVLDLCLDATAELMVEARRLPGLLKSRHLAMESAVIVRIADKLTGELRRRDPIAERVELSKPQFLGCALRGIASVCF